MTLQLAVQITADASRVRPGTAEASREFGSVGKALDKMAQDGRSAATALDAVSRSASSRGAAGDVSSGYVRLTEVLREATAEARNVTAAIERTARVSRGAAINASIGVRDDFGGAARAADIEGYGRSLDDVRAKYNPLFAAQRTYLAQLSEIRQAEKAGALSSKEAAAAIDRTKASFAAQVTGLRGVRTELAGLAPWQRTQLAAQGFDVFTSLGGGMNPLTVALQQGPQIIQVYGGVRETLSAALGVLTPLRVGLGGATGALIAGAMAWDNYLVSTKEVATANAGLGRALGATPAELEAIAEAASAAGAVSIAQARSMEAAFLRTGRIGTAGFAGLIGISKDFAATIGTDIDGARDKLGELFADPARGASQLQQMGLLDGATTRLVQRLTQQNETTRAQGVLLEALRPRLASAAEATTAFGRAWDGVARAASNAWDAIGRSADWLSGGGADTLAARMADAQGRLVALNEVARRRGVANPAGREAIQAEIADLQEQLRREQQLTNRRAADARADRASSTAIESAAQSPANEQALRRRALEQSQAQLIAGQGAAGQTADEQANIARALDARSRALQTLVPAAQKQAELDRLDIAVQSERNPMLRAELIARRERVAIAGEEITAGEADARVQQARNRAIAESLATTRRSIADLETETAARRSVNDMVAAGTVSLADADRQLAQERAIRPLVAAALSAEGDERARLIALIQQQRGAMAAAATEDRRSAAQSMLSDQRDRADSLRLEISLIGQSEAVRARAVATMEAEQRIRQAGIASGSAEAGQIRANAAALAELETAASRTRDAWGTFASAGESALDRVGDALSGQKVDWQSLAQDIQRSAMQLAVVNPLKNALLGTNYGTLGDLGGIFGGGATSALAGARTVGAMQVSAGTVVVNGAIAGGAAGVLGAIGTGTGTGTGGGMSGVLARSMSYNGLNENGSAGAINALLGQSGTPQLDARTQAWCAAYANAVLGQSGMAGTGSNMASSFLNWGQATSSPSLGDIVNLRPQAAGSSGHVGFFAGMQGNNVLVNGGNQGFGAGNDGVGTVAFPMNEVVSFRTALDSATTATSGFGTGLSEVAQSALNSAGGISTSATQLGQATQSAATSATGFTGGLGGAFQQILGGLGQIGSGFLNGIGSVFQSLLGGLGGLGGGGGGGLLSSLASMFAFEAGGVMTAAGPLPLHRYAMGGVADRPQLALFGEGRQPEAFVPLPDGRRIPVSMSMPRGTNDNSAFAAAAQMSQMATQMMAAASRPGSVVNIIDKAGVNKDVEQSEGRDGEERFDIVLDRAAADAFSRPGSITRRRMADTFGLQRKVSRL
ncbi:MAG TPA: phage tail length tape measure family protein [Xanthobacteraceae bacterium]|nr:phage tail length tape measure family protein [Xanthobacteraceae bacterium]